MNLAGRMLGPYIAGGVGGKIDTIRQWQPRLITILDPSRSDIEQLREACPNAVIHQRVYVADGEVERMIRNDYRAAARETNRLLHEKAYLLDDMMFGSVENEVLDKENPHQNHGDTALLNDYAVHCVNLANDAGIRRYLLNTSVGWPDMPEGNRMQYWEKVYPTLRAARDGGHMVCVHQYGGRNMLWPNDGLWTSRRLEEQVLPRLPSEFRGVRWAITEYGVSNVAGAPKGWLSPDSDYSGDHVAYTNDMIQIVDDIYGYDDQIVGYSVWMYGNNGDPKFLPNDITGPCAKRLSTTGAVYTSVPFEQWLMGGIRGGEQVMYKARVVNAHRLNVRPEPNLSRPPIFQLAINRVVDVLSDNHEENRNGSRHIWWRVTFEDGGRRFTGYCHSRYLQRVDDAPVEPPQPPSITLEQRVAALESEVHDLKVIAEAAVMMLSSQGRTLDDLVSDSHTHDDEPTKPVPPSKGTRLGMGISELENHGVTLKVSDSDIGKYQVVEMFTTHYGSWEVVRQDPYSVPQWARDQYLKPFGAPDYHHDAGGDHHVFVRLEDVNGSPVSDVVVFQQRNAEELGERVFTSSAHGWANYVLWPDLIVNVRVDGQTVSGVRMPANNEHVSIWIVYRAVE